MQKQLKLLLENLILSAAAISICAIASFFVSFPINRMINPEAAVFNAQSRSGTGTMMAIDTSKLEDYRRTQGVVVLFGATVGVLSAQTVRLRLCFC